ncbi:FHA domain-containing protein [Rhabdothermincola sp. EGI L10124]|nr:FHA domain-containing protein [Rhabdothermincola salaria]
MQNQSIAIGRDGEIGVLGTRPPLGIVTLDDGSIYQLSDDLVLGRDPQPDGHLVAIVDDRSVSRNHLRIHLDGWEVMVEDLGSSNGSHLLAPGASTYTRLSPHVTVPVVSGTVMAFGQRWASFEATAAAG